MPQTFPSAVAQLGMDGQLAKTLQTAAGLNGNLKAEIVAVTPLTGAFGTPGSAIVDVTTGFVQATLNNNFRALEDKVNALIAALKA